MWRTLLIFSATLVVVSFATQSLVRGMSEYDFLNVRVVSALFILFLLFRRFSYPYFKNRAIQYPERASQYALMFVIQSILIAVTVLANSAYVYYCGASVYYLLGASIAAALVLVMGIVKSRKITLLGDISHVVREVIVERRLREAERDETHTGYSVRAFCTAETPPTIRTILNALAADGFDLTLGEDYSRPDVLDDPNWQQFVLSYKPDKAGIIVDCDRNDGGEGCHAAEEIQEFIDAIASSEDPEAGQRVIAHLKTTRFIIVCRLPADGIDDDGFNVTRQLLSYFVSDYAGMIQVDGEGFYVGNQQAVPEE